MTWHLRRGTVMRPVWAEYSAHEYGTHLGTPLTSPQVRGDVWKNTHNAGWSGVCTVGWHSSNKHDGFATADAAKRTVELWMDTAILALEAR